LIATIKHVRPDLLPGKHAPVALRIPELPPEGFLDTLSNYIEDIGEPPTASFFTSTTINPTNWYDKDTLYSLNPKLLSYQIVGGYLRNTMGCAAFGIRGESAFIHAKGRNLIYPLI